MKKEDKKIEIEETNVEMPASEKNDYRYKEKNTAKPIKSEKEVTAGNLIPEGRNHSWDKREKGGPDSCCIII